MEFTFEIRKLSNLFYEDYPQADYPEIERKESRGYTSMLVDTHEGYIICIPFRTNISHGNAYLFKNSIRSRTHRSGLDYSKICIITDLDYIDDTPGIVDKDEYAETRGNIGLIVEEACQYIDDYISQIEGSVTLSNSKFHKRYWFSTLRYFHRELGITDSD